MRPFQSPLQISVPRIFLRATFLLEMRIYFRQLSWGEVINASAIYIGAVAEDSSGYPDCRQFYRHSRTRSTCGTKPETHLTIRTPVIHMKKSEIVRKGVELGAPLHLTWSCYQASELACGNCDSCALRLRAFREAGVADPIPYMLDSSRFAY